MKIYLHHNRKNNPTGGPVQFEVYFSRTSRVYFSPGVSVEKKYWDNRSKEIKPEHPDHMLLNSKIDAMRQKLLSIATEYVKRDVLLTADMLKVEMDKTPSSNIFNDYFAMQIEYDRRSVKDSTYRRIKSVLKNFNEFRQVSFSECDTQMIREYHNHLLKSMQQTSTPKNHKTLSKYLKRALQDGLIKQNPYINFRIPAYAQRRVFLTADELETIRAKEISIERINVVRHLFLFMCNTGLEYIDLMKLTAEDITEINGKKYIVKSRMKVEGEMQAIPLFPEALEIIDRYSSGTGFIFPRRSNQRLNSYLTELAAICGITKPLSTIVARHTFATLMLTKGMPLESVSHIMGHSNTKTTRIYAKMIVSKIENDLRRLNIESI